MEAAAAIRAAACYVCGRAGAGGKDRAPAGETFMMEPTPAGVPAGAPADREALRRISETAREAWSQALVTVGAAEEEVQKLLARLTGWVEEGPEEARRVAAELTERLRKERGELETTFDAAVRRALGPFRLPTRDQIAEIDARLDRLEERVSALAARREMPRA